jgi:hypothetical protein
VLDELRRLRAAVGKALRVTGVAGMFGEDDAGEVSRSGLPGNFGDEAPAIVWAAEIAVGMEE